MRVPASATKFAGVGLLGWTMVCAPAAFAADEQGTGLQQSRLAITWENKLVSIDAVDADLLSVVKLLSERSGVQIGLYEGVAGKVTLREEKAPIEKAVDRILAAAGQRNYLMVFEGGDLTKMSIVPRSAGGAAGEAVKRVKVRGKLRSEDVYRESKGVYMDTTGRRVTGNLRTGKEIEYYPGEVVVTVKRPLFPAGPAPTTTQEEAFYAKFVDRLERNHGLSLIKRTKLYFMEAFKFRILNGRDVIDVMYEMVESPDNEGVVCPNGLGPKSVEFPDEDFNVLRGITKKELQECSSRGLDGNECRMEKMPFLRWERLHKEAPLPFPYMEGLFLVGHYSSAELARQIARAHDEGALWLGTGGESYLFFPEVHGPEATVAMWNKLGRQPMGWRPMQEEACWPTDTLWPDQWNLQKIRAAQAWEIESGARDVKVAVVEQGFDADHLDFGSRLSPESANCDVPTDGTEGSVAPIVGVGSLEEGGEDLPGHGSRVAGIIGAVTNNAIGIAGVAGGGCDAGKGVTLLAMQVSDEYRSAERAFWYAAGVLLSDRVEYLAGEASLDYPRDPALTTWTVVSEAGENHAWTDSPSADYDDALPRMLTYKRWDLRNSEALALRLSFRAKWALADGDLVYVERSDDDGVTWSVLSFLAGTMSQWQTENYALDFPSPGGRPKNFRIRFRLAPNGDGATDDGVSVDDVEIQILTESQPRIKAQVMNMSFWLYADPAYVLHALEVAYDKGVSLVYAAGNLGVTLESFAQARQGLPTPAGIDDKILIVGATDRNDRKWNLSNHGGILDVSAPGVGIVSTDGEGGYSSLASPAAVISGTSYAAPQVAGLAALIRSKFPDLKPEDVYKRIKSSADPLTPGMGDGRVNAYSALRDQRDTSRPGRPRRAHLIPGPSDIKVAWDAADDDDAIGEYEVYRRGSANGAACAAPVAIAGYDYCLLKMAYADGSNGDVSPVVTITGDTYTLTDAAIAENEHYFYHVIAVDKTGNKSVPSAALGPAHALLAPEAPASLQNRTGDGKVRLGWAASTLNADGSWMTDLAEYRVYVSTRAPRDPNATLVMTVGSGALECTITDLPNDATYYFAVRAVDQVGNESEPSNWVTARPARGIWVQPAHGDYTSIKTALENAPKGTTVIVGPGTYYENGLSLGQAAYAYEPYGIILRSEQGPERTIIRSGTPDVPLSIAVNDGCKIIGFMIRDFGTYGGVYCGFADDVLIANNIFIADGAFADPTGVALSGYSVVEGRPFENLPLRVRNNTFRGSMTAIVTHASSRQVVDIAGNIFADPDTAIGLGGEETDFKSMPDYHVSFNAFTPGKTRFNNPWSFKIVDWGNKDVDITSTFVDYNPGDPWDADYHLAPTSSCRDAGNPALMDDEGKPWSDCDGSIADLGAYGGPYAFVDANHDGVADCEQLQAWPMAITAVRGSQGNPMTLGGYDPSGSALTYEITQYPTHGTVTGTAPNLFYNSSGDAAVEDGIGFRVSNGRDSSAEARVTIVVRGANTEPVAQDMAVAVQPSAGPEVTPTIFDLQASDIDGDSLSFTVVTQPGVGTLACEGPPRCHYTPETGFVGVTSFTYHASDGIAQSGTATVWLEVHGTNAAPTARALSLMEPSTATRVDLDVRCEDPDGDPSRLELAWLPAAGELHCDALTSAYPSGSGPACWYDFAESFAGEVSFGYRCNDGSSVGATAAATIRKNLDPVIDERRPAADEVSIPEDGGELFEVWASDPDGLVTVLDYQWFLDGTPVGTDSWYRYSPSSGTAAGGPYELTVAVSDGPGTTERSWSIHVLAAVTEDDGAETVTGWTTASSRSGYLGGGYHQHDAVAGATGTVSFVWNVPVATPGVYKVYARWPAASTFTTDATYYVTDANGVADVLKADQTANGGQWNSLGTYRFEVNARIVLKVRKDETGVADAVRLEATQEPADIIVDDADGNPYGDGAWLTQTGGFAGTYRTAAKVASALDPTDEFASEATPATATFTWTAPEDPPGVSTVRPGSWDLYARWMAVGQGASNVKYVVSFGRSDGISSQVTVNQGVNGGRWVPLGSYCFAEGDLPSIMIGNNANGTVVADAIKLVYRSGVNSSIVDNDRDADFDPDSTDTFGWRAAYPWNRRAGGSGFIGSDYRQIAKAEADATYVSWAEWRLPVVEDGNYEIYARWVAGTDRTTAAKYDIRHVGQLKPDVVIINQQVDGGVWNYLGRFKLDVEHESAIRVWQSADGVTVADAVMFLKTDEDLPIIVDNASDERFSAPGVYQWAKPLQPVAGFWGGDYVQTEGQGNTATWWPRIETAGYYDVFARWTSAADRTKAAEYEIEYDGGPAVVNRDQTKNGGVWVGLGRYFLQPGDPSITLTTTDTMQTVADAVRYDYTIYPPAIVIDNNGVHNEFPNVCANDASWPVSATFVDSYDDNYDPVDKNYLVRNAATAGSVRWIPSLPLRGYYAVHAWWPTPSAAVVGAYATQAPFTIVHEGASAGEQRLMNQQVNGGKWNYLGTYLFDAGTEGYVELKPATTGKVLADAVRFTPEGR